MPVSAAAQGTQAAKLTSIEAGALEQLISTLRARGYRVIGPTVRDGAIVLDTIETSQDLPVGWTDQQEPGRYRIKLRDDQLVFGYSVGPQSWKRFLHPPELRLFSAERENGSFRILNNVNAPDRPLALLGVRPCDLSAIAVQDRVLLGDKYQDGIYAARRNSAFIVAVQCNQSAPTCFCASLATGPHVHGQFDLALTEISDSRGHRFLIQTGTERGSELVAELDGTEASAEDIRIVETLAEQVVAQQVRSIDREAVRNLLYEKFDDQHWDDIASRCLACGNCTMACPTCFCITIEDTSDVTGKHAERWRRWDSCFTQSFSYIHGGSIRASAKARYRQWMMHKLASWIDQFGTPGCVGCGRCITWCPAAIDITQEARAMKEAAHGNT